jgi:hypothetical protein
MRFYRVSYSTMRDSSLGFSWHRSRRDAAAAGRTFRDDNKTEEEVEAVIQPIDIEPSRQGILDALNTYATHNDNG